MKENIKIGISGKRFISPEESSRVYKEIRERIKDILKKHKAHGFTGYTALASGADTIFADVVRKEFQQPLQVILPFPAGEYEKDFEGADLETFRNLIRETGQQELAVTTAPADSDTRNAAYYKAGIMIVDQCDEMVFVWDELRPGGVGGTAEILGYFSEKKGHLPVDPVKVKPAQQDELHCALIRKYERANNLAMKARDKYKRVWKWAIFLGWLTVVCFACKTAFHLEGTAGYMLTLSEFLFVVAVYALTFYAKKRKYHGHYLGERMKAETCRLLFCFYHAGVRIDISDKAKEDSSMAASAGDINQSLRVAGHRSKWYTQYVIRTLIHEQCSYHHNKVKTIGNTHELAERINLFIAVAFVVNLAAHLIHLSVQEEAWHFWLYDLSVFFNILLPASYAALEGVIYFNEWALLKKHSEVAGKRLGEAEHLLPENLSLHSDEDCHKKQARVLHIVSETMLTDNRNWNLLLENKNNYHLIV